MNSKKALLSALCALVPVVLSAFPAVAAPKVTKLPVVTAPQKKATPAATTAQAPAKPAPEVTLYRDATFLLPAGAKVEPRWVLPPSGRGSSDVMFSVDDAGTPVMVSNGLLDWGSTYLLNPIAKYMVALNAPVSGITHTSGGVLLMASGSDLVLPAVSGEKSFNKKDIPVAALQPLTTIPLERIEVLASSGPTVYCAGPIRGGRHALYLLRSMKGAGIKDLELAYESGERITAVTGDSDHVYVATGSTVTRVSLRDGARDTYYTHPSAPVKALVKTDAGLLVSTDRELVLAGAGGAMEIMRSAGHRIYVRGDTLYVLFTTSLGVIALDNISDLKRYNLSVRAVAPGEAEAPLRIANVRFFESGSLENTRGYADTFDRKDIRRIVARIDFAAPKSGSQKKHSVTLSWYEPTGGQLRSTTYRIASPGEPLYAAIGGESEGYTHPRQQNKGGVTYRFGKDALGMRYPGQYRFLVQVDGIPAGEWSFTLTGKPEPGVVIAYDDTAMMKTLLDEGLSAKSGSDGHTPLLFQAIQFGSARMVNLLLERGADPNGVDEEGHPPLDRCELASEWREKAEELIRHGANMNVRKYPGGPPLVDTYSPEALLFYLQKGASVSFEKDSLGRDSIISLLSENSCSDEIVSLLIQRGSNINQVSSELWNYTPLGKAIFFAWDRCAELLLNRGASTAIVQNQPNRPPHSALYVALNTLSERTEAKEKAAVRRIIRLLLQRGATLLPGKKLSFTMFDVSLDEYGRYLEEQHSIMSGEGRVMFKGENASFFERVDMVRTLEQDDAALEEATKSQDPRVRELALDAHVSRVRERTAKALKEADLKYTAHDHCIEAFKLAEVNYRLMQVDIVPDPPESVQGKPQLGIKLLKRDSGGAYVQGVLPGSPAERAGLKAGDIILALDIQKMKDVDEILATMARQMPGMPVRLTFLRDDSMRFPDLQLTCGLLENEVKELHGYAKMNLSRWLERNPDAALSGEVRTKIVELAR